MICILLLFRYTLIIYMPRQKVPLSGHPYQHPLLFCQSKRELCLLLKKDILSVSQNGNFVFIFYFIFFPPLFFSHLLSSFKCCQLQFITELCRDCSVYFGENVLWGNGPFKPKVMGQFENALKCTTFQIGVKCLYLFLEHGSGGQCQCCLQNVPI